MVISQREQSLSGWHQRLDVSPLGPGILSAGVTARPVAPLLRYPVQPVELNATFYRLPQVKTCQRWHDVAPEAFRYAVKVSRFITHIKRLHDCGDALETFLDRVRHLGDRG